MKFDVHRIEAVRIKVAQVEAETPEQALAITEAVDFHELIDREVAISVERSCGPGAFVASMSFHEAPPASAMVEIADSHGEQGEHHFDHLGDQFVRAVPADLVRREALGLFPPNRLDSRAYLGKLSVMEGEHEDSVPVLICAESYAAAELELATMAASYYGEAHQAKGDAREGFDHGNGVLVRPGAGPVEISEATFYEMKPHLTGVHQLGCPMPLAFDVRAVLAAMPSLVEVIAAADDALDQLETQIGQMRGMFGADESIDDAVEAASHARLELDTLQRYLRAPRPDQTAEHRWFAAGPQLRAVIRNTVGAIASAAQQVQQMREMFDDQDGTIRASVTAARKATSELMSLLGVLKEQPTDAPASEQEARESGARERMRS